MCACACAFACGDAIIYKFNLVVDFLTLDDFRLSGVGLRLRLRGLRLRLRLLLFCVLTTIGILLLRLRRRLRGGDEVDLALCL
jgi:hypothetical protein